MLMYDPKSRISLDRALGHKWFERYNANTHNDVPLEIF